jgi:hypothetical protein
MLCGGFDTLRYSTTAEKNVAEYYTRDGELAVLCHRLILMPYDKRNSIFRTGFAFQFQKVVPFL